MSDDKTYEMLWDCQFCGTEKLLGKTHRFCPNCGAAQEPDARYYPSDEEKVAVEDHVFVGVDKTCDSCDALNAGNAEYCGTCGAPLTDAARAKKLAAESRAEGESFESSGSRDVSRERFQDEMQRVGLTEDGQPKKKTASLVPIAIGGVLVVVIAAALLAIFWRQEQTAFVSGHEWERVIAIEEYGPQEQSEWCDSMPGDAYSVSRRSEQRGSRQVADGEDCRTVRQDNGDGTFTERQECTTRYRSEPVYDDRCYFTVDRWEFARDVEARGSSLNEDPYWPEPNLRRTGECIGCEKEGRRTETYRVFLESDGNTYTCSLNHDQWAAMPIESLWRVPIGVISNQPDCNALERAS